MKGKGRSRRGEASEVGSDSFLNIFAANVSIMMEKNVQNDIAVRPALDRAERDRWDETMRKRHYLEFRGMVGEAVRHVAAAPNGD